MSEQLLGPPGPSKVDSLGSMSEQLLGPPGHSKVVADVGSDDDSRDSYSDKASIDVVGPPSVLPWACSIDVAGPPLVLPGAGSTGRAGSTDTPWPSVASVFWRLLVGLTF